MKPVVKYTAAAAALVIVLLAVAAAVLYSVVDTEFIKTEAAKAAKERTGRDLVFTGDVRISVFPWLGVELGPVALSNAPGFGDAPMAAVRRADVKVKLMPLFSGQVMVGSVVVDGLALNLGRDAKGVTNFDDIVRKLSGGGAAAPATPPAPSGDAAGGSGSGASSLAALGVGGVSLTNASLTWDDRMQDKHYTVSDLNLTTGPLAAGQPFDLALDAKAESSTPALRATVDLKAKADLGPDFMAPAVRGLTLTLDAEGGDIPGGKAHAVFTGDILLDLARSIVTVKNMALAAYDLKATGDVSVSKFDSAPVVDATLALESFSPKALLASLGLPEIKTTDPEALTRATVSLAATATQEAATLRDLKLTVDDTTLSGTASVKNFARPAVAFNLAATALDADRYLPPAEKAEAPKAPQEAGKPGTKAPQGKDGGLPKEALRKLDVDGAISVERLTVSKVRMSDVQVTIKAKDGVLRVTPLSAGLYGGLFKTSLTADVRGEAMKTDLDLGLSGMGLGDLLADLAGQDKITGVTALDLTLAATGDEWKSMVRTLAGKGSFGLKDGAFKGFQIIPEAVRAQAAASDPQKRAEKIEKQQKFKDIGASFNIAKGIVTSGDATLNADGLKGLGKGSVDLAAQTIDYKAVVDITAMPSIPFTIKGSLTDPAVSLDTAQFVKGLAQGVVNLPVDVGKGLLDTGKGALEGLGSGLKNIFGGGKPKDSQEKTQP